VATKKGRTKICPPFVAVFGSGIQDPRCGMDKKSGSGINNKADVTVKNMKLVCIVS
jgi:hypothetical protein